MSKNLRGVSRSCKKAFNQLLSLSQEVGAYAIISSYQYHKKIKLQCEREKLREWLDRNDLEFNSMFFDSLAYETEDFILFF